MRWAGSPSSPSRSVAAVCNELRKRGVVDRARPARLTPAGRAGLALPAAGQPPVKPGMPGLRLYRGVAIPALPGHARR